MTRPCLCCLTSLVIVIQCLSVSEAFAPVFRPNLGLASNLRLSRQRTVRYIMDNRALQESTKIVADKEHEFGLLNAFWKMGPEGYSENPVESPKERKYALISHNNSDESPPAVNAQALVAGIATLLACTGLAFAHSSGLSLGDAVNAFEQLIHHPQETLQAVIEHVEAMGPAAPIYFGIMYLIAEILAVPATPLTLSAGYLFGLVKGTSVVLVAATIAACVAFVIGKTFMRSWVEGMLEDNPKFRKLDAAIGKEGFKLLLLVRLSPIFPFALSNYLYGASSIDFASYFWGTLLGFAPGTVAYIYAGMVGKALTLGEGGQPWYIYAGGFAALLAFLKVVTDVASNVVAAIEEED